LTAKNAVKYCIDRNILRGFFETISSEVVNILTDEWNWEEYKEEKKGVIPQKG
jgi:hypothetical protein